VTRLNVVSGIAFDLIHALTSSPAALGPGCNTTIARPCHRAIRLAPAASILARELRSGIATTKRDLEPITVHTGHEEVVTSIADAREATSPLPTGWPSVVTTRPAID